MDAYEIAEVNDEVDSTPSTMPSLWYEALSEQSSYSLLLIRRDKHQIGDIEEYLGYGQPAKPRLLTPGYQREVTCSEGLAGSDESWDHLYVQEVTGPYQVQIGEKTYGCLAFEDMILSPDRVSVHLNIYYVSAAGRRVLMRRWEGEAGAGGSLEKCKEMDYKGYRWRQHYDDLFDVQG